LENNNGYRRGAARAAAEAKGFLPTTMACRPSATGEQGVGVAIALAAAEIFARSTISGRREEDEEEQQQSVFRELEHNGSCTCWAWKKA
jgi:hypothetical protein